MIRNSTNTPQRQSAGQYAVVDSAYDHAMKKGNFAGMLCAGLMLIPLVLTSLASAQDSSVRIVVEDIPALTDIYKVSASQTPSGFPVPRYVSLKSGKVNGRTGPSLKHPIAWQYQRRSMPVIIVAETEMWRKVRDYNGDESWVHKRLLSGERTVITLENVDLHAKPRDTSRVTALANRNALLYLETCQETGYCRVRSTKGHKGWVRRSSLWGTTKL